MAATAKKSKASKATAALKASELRGQKADELKGQLIALRKEAFNLRFQAATGELQNTNRKRQVRRDIARIQTVLREQGVSAGAGASKAGAKSSAKKAKAAPKAKSAKTAKKAKA